MRRDYRQIPLSPEGQAIMEKFATPLRWPITEKAHAANLAEAIRRAITYEHLPNCNCGRNLRNECSKVILEAALRDYWKDHPEDVI